jgi:DNA (cytosine-5)-methyltransferase 1
MRLKLLDLYCGAGGAAVGYHRAGFDVVGVDIAPQPHYPFRFVQMDVFDFLRRFDVCKHFNGVHASPPCQGYSSTRSLHEIAYPKLIKRTRHALRRTQLPYVIENVPGAHPAMHSPQQLCGSSFGLRVRRHRLFECSFAMPEPPRCQHAWQDADKRFHTFTSAKHIAEGRPPYKSGIVGVYGRGQGLGAGESLVWSAVMGITWMTKTELAEAIPPAYTQWIGSHLVCHLLGHRVAP